MSNTVYSRVQEFAKTSTFKFHSAGINLIGQFVAREWRQKGGTMDQLNVVQSTEADGHVFMVYAYPDSFVTNIDSIIQRYANWCIMPKKKKTIIEKPAPSRPVPDPISSSLPPKKTRTRKPIQKPHFSGKILMKK